MFFSPGPVRDFAGAKAADHERYARFFHHMLDRGVWLPPIGYELWTLGTEHGPDEVELVLDVAAAVRGLSHPRCENRPGIVPGAVPTVSGVRGYDVTTSPRRAHSTIPSP